MSVDQSAPESLVDVVLRKGDYCVCDSAGDELQIELNPVAVSVRVFKMNGDFESYRPASPPEAMRLVAVLLGLHQSSQQESPSDSGHLRRTIEQLRRGVGSDGFRCDSDEDSIRMVVSTTPSPSLAIHTYQHGIQQQAFAPLLARQALRLASFLLGLPSPDDNFPG